MEKYVDKVYVINMDKDLNKLENINNILIENNINYERFSGIDVNLITKDEYNKYTNNISYYLTDSIIGCGISHIKLWEKVIENNYKSVLILEDDVFIIQNNDYNLYDVLDNAYKELPKDFDILYLGCMGLCNEKYIYNDWNIIYKLLINESKNNIKYNNFNHIFIPEYPVSAISYIISYNGCKKLLSQIKTVNYHIDIMIQYCNLNKYAVKQKIINQNTINSSNSDYSFPKTINKILRNYHDENFITYDFIFNMCLFKLGNHIITLFVIIFFILGILSFYFIKIFIIIALFFNFENLTHKTSKTALTFFFLGYIITFLFNKKI